MKQETTWDYVNNFARNALNLYYLWQNEIKGELEPSKWVSSKNPIEKVREIRYKDASGKDIDKWTELTDDFESFYSSVSGSGKTYGFDFVLYGYGDSSTDLCAVVTFTYENSPAREAGLKRGDVILKINNEQITRSNYSSLLSNALYKDESVILGFKEGNSVTLNAVDMYENPVHTVSVLDMGDKKIGYLHFTSFTLDAAEDLVDAFGYFKTEGIEELILDLRYNGGGFVFTEEVLASMLAPQETVNSGSVLSMTVYNNTLTQYFRQKGEDVKSYFKTEFSTTSDGKNYSVNTENANPGISKLYAIITSSTASASEAVLCELSPYMDITIVGERSYGKYCTGIMMEGSEFYSDYEDQMNAEYAAAGKKQTKNWGLYVMIGRYADCNGQTLCMPDGLTPDFEADDRPWEEYELGDVRESMLSKTLEICGYAPAGEPSTKSASFKTPIEHHRPGFGVFVSDTEVPTKGNY